MSKRQELELKQQQAARKQWIQVGVIIGAIALVLIGGAIVLSETSKPKAPELPAVVVVQKPVPPSAEVNGRAWGPKDAPIKIEEFLDFQCPACASFSRDAEAGVIEAFASSGKVRFESNNFQFKGNESRRAGAAAICAADQNQYWSMNATIFANQPRVHGEDDLGYFSDARLKEMAQKLGLDMPSFSTCLDSRKYEAQVQAEFDRAESLGIQQTPTFLVNGKPFPGVRTVDDFKKIFAEVAPEVRFE